MCWLLTSAGFTERPLRLIKCQWELERFSLREIGVVK